MALKKADEALARVGLAHRLHHRVTTLSGGERQRAAIARAILLEPQVILADEPTGNLDDRTGREINDLLLNLNQDRNVTLIIVTHNAELARCMGRTLELRSGWNWSLQYFNWYTLFQSHARIVFQTFND